MTMADGTPVTARTRNGLIGVFKLGDANGDDSVDVQDILSAATIIKGTEDESFVPEMSDANEDGTTDDQDIESIIEIIKDNSNGEK